MINKNQRCKDKWSHSFIGDRCEWCGISQLELSKKNFESEFDYLFPNWGDEASRKEIIKNAVKKNKKDF